MGFGDNLKKLVTTAAGEISRLQDLAEQQKVKQSQKEIDAARERNEEVLSLPTAQVQLTASGWLTGEWSGQMHYGWNEISGDGLDKLLWFELFAAQGQEPVLAGRRLTHWSFQLYGWHGDGTYDLVDLLHQREATGWSTDFLEWGVDFADADDMSSYFHSGSSPSSVTVSHGGTRFSVSISTSGAYGDLTLAAEITRAA
jgi:hypothetical protein